MIDTTQIKENILLISPTQEKIVDYFIIKTIKYLNLYIEDMQEEHLDLIEELTIYNIEVWKQAGIKQEKLSERTITYAGVEMSDMLICLLKKYNIPLVDKEELTEGVITGW